ncbi:peroxiredoxin [Lutibacter sp.]|uniref:peroxiredoxin n=1 Tax=Lutibacter sp. TaxID=1925666 RepID=UPI0027375692|nr:peroxiredoxin [Lutibacter sp.]MDP3314427.1 peroxiredoxin [Lutibacter sp.]
MKNTLNFLVIFTITISSFAQNSNELKVGDVVSNFSSTDDQGNKWESKNVKSNFLVIYFYPAAMTGGCTKQACAYRDSKNSLDQLGVTVIGVSGDEVTNLKHFKNSYQLNFPLLSDIEGKIANILGVPTDKGGSITREINGENYLLIRGITTPRWTFVLDKNRKIIYKNSEVNAEDDSKKVQEIIKNYLKK